MSSLDDFGADSAEHFFIEVSMAQPGEWARSGPFPVEEARRHVSLFAELVLMFQEQNLASVEGVSHDETWAIRVFWQSEPVHEESWIIRFPGDRADCPMCLRLRTAG